MSKLQLKLIYILMWLFAILVALYPYSVKANECWNGTQWIEFKWLEPTLRGYNGVTENKELLIIEPLEIMDNNKTYIIEHSFICIEE